jgi:hypothetical protein
MSNLTTIIEQTLALHQVKSIERMSDDPTDYGMYNEHEIICTCDEICAPDDVDDAEELPRFSAHQAAAVSKKIDEELLATVNKAAMHLARAAFREHSGPTDEKLETGVKGYLYALRNREPRAEFGESFFSYPSLNDLRNELRAR